MSPTTISARYKTPALEAKLLQLAAHACATAEKKAAGLVIAARKKAADNLRGARQRAKKLGYESALQLASQELLEQMLSLQRNYEKSIENIEQDCLQLSLSIAEEVIQKQLTIDKESLVIRMKTTLKNLIDKHSLTIRVSSGSEDLIRSEIKPLFPNSRLRIEGSPGIESGNARIETSSGRIELAWKDHLEMIRGKLRNSLTKAQTQNIQD